MAKLKQAATNAQFDGEWFLIGEDGYDDAREQYATTSFNEADVSPGIILYPAVGKGVEDIQKAIKMCRDLGMAIAVRTGGHQYCGYSSTSPMNMQVDLSKTFPEYQYDKDNNILKCGVSHALGDWAGLNNEQDIYLPMGVCAHVHLGGHVHTGGWGIVGRSHGLLADHVLSFDIILADGNQKTVVKPESGVTDQANDDLFYAVLGGSKGGDFGIVTHWTFSPLRNADYPNSACYNFTWLWSKDRMQAVVENMQRLSKLCADGTVPGDYEFMLTITGTGEMNLLPSLVKEGFDKLDKDEKSKLFGTIEKYIAKEVSHLDKDLLVPPLIQMWMCYTNKGGPSVAFDDQWFESFAQTVDEPLPFVSHRNTNKTVSAGILDQFIMHQDREMEYPFVKRSRVTMNVPDDFPATYTDRMWDIMNIFGLEVGTDGRQHLVSQMQIYAGGMIAKNGKSGITSYSWRDQAFAMSHDSFYNVGGLFGDASRQAEKWQRKNDRAFIGNQKYADKDMRMFAYTFGNRVLDEVWQHYYDSQDKYDRLKAIKQTVDPDGIFTADEFCVDPD